MSSETPSGGRGLAVELAEALVEGTDEAMVLVGGGAAVAIRDGRPLSAELGLSLEEVLDDPASYLTADDLAMVREALLSVCAGAGNSERGTFVVQSASGEPVQIDAIASNLEHTAMNAVVIRLRTGRMSQLPSPPPSDSTWPEKSQFLELVQRAVDRKVKRVWSVPKHARSVTRDRRCDFAVVLLNLDRYGMLRGNFGEQQLDSLMRDAADRLRRALRARDAVAHLGRSELAMFLDGVVDEQQAARVTDAYTRILEDRFDLAGESVSLSAVVGIATSERRYDEAQDVLRDCAAAVSRAMRRARTGRQAYQSGIRKEDRRRLILSADLRESLRDGDLFVEYQPIIRVGTLELVGFEALSRWNHPTLAKVGPNEFIPVAEEVGLIRQLGNRVLKTACQQVAAWNQGPGRTVTISVNVSAAEIVHGTFATEVAQVLRKTSIDPSLLMLEVTESALLEDIEAAKRNMLELRKRGVQFALDDFGTGYASMAYLVDLPFNRLKIDRSLIADSHDPHRGKVVSAVIALGHELGLAVVAEGVETEAQAHELSTKRCDFVQGYLYGRPMGVSAATRMITGD